MNDILEYIEVTNDGLGVFDGSKDMVIIEDYNPQTPVIRPPYIAENVANKVNNLNNPNSTGYTTSLAVYNAINQATSGLTANWNTLINRPTWLTGTTLNQFQSGHTHNYNLLNNLPTLFTGNTFIQSGGTIISKNGNNVIIYSPSGGSGNYNFIESGATKIKADTNNITIYSPSGVSGNYITSEVFTGHTGDTSIHFKMSGITISQSQVTNLINALANKSDTGHTHTQYLLTSIFSGFTGTTLPSNYYNKTQINNYTGTTGAIEFLSYDGSDLTTNLAINNNVASFPVPYNCTLLGVFGALDTVASGSSFIVDIYYSGATIFGTYKIIIESGEYSSLTTTNQPTLSVVNWIRGVKLNTRITQVGASTKGKGLTIHLMLRRT